MLIILINNLETKYLKLRRKRTFALKLIKIIILSLKIMRKMTMASIGEVASNEMIRKSKSR